jgi:hypothetical protein
MRQEGISGARRGKAFTFTTTSDDRLERPADLVSREFKAPAFDRLWVADLTYVKTHAGWVYVAFIIDVYSRFIVGWEASRSLGSDLAIDALEMAVFNRRRAGADLAKLVHHSDRGCNICRSAIPNASPTTRSSRRSDRKATATTTRWRSRSTALQKGADLPARTMPRPRRRRVRDSHLRRLVQQPTPSRRDHRRRQLHDPHRVRSHLLPSQSAGPRGRHPIARAVT